MVDVDAIAAPPGFIVAKRYVLTRAVRRPAVGHAYLADDTIAAKQVLLVLDRARWTSDPARRELFKRRAARLQALEHANIAALLDYGFEGELAYGIVERFDGERLCDRIARKRRISVEELIPIASQLLKALEVLHARGVVARCVDPAHVLLCTDGVHANIVRLLGAGVAELLQNEDPPREGGLIPDRAYAAPEQLQGAVVGPRADVFAVGKLLATVMQAGRSNEVPLSQRGTASFHIPAGSPGIPEPIRQLLDSCLQLDPDRRPADGGELVELLIDAVPNASMFRLPRVTGSHASVSTVSPTSSGRFRRAPQPVVPPSVAVETPPATRRSIGLPVVAAAVLLLAGAAYLGTTRDEPPPDETELPPIAEVAAPAPPVQEAEPEAKPAPNAELGVMVRTPEPDTGDVRIETTPAGAIVIDGVARGTTPFDGPLAPGPHEVVVQGDDRQRWVGSIDVEPGENPPWKLELELEVEAEAQPNRGRDRSRTRGKKKRGGGADPAVKRVEPPAPPPETKPKPKKKPRPATADDDPFLPRSKKAGRTDLLPRGRAP